MKNLSNLPLDVLPLGNGVSGIAKTRIVFEGSHVLFYWGMIFDFTMKPVLLFWLIKLKLPSYYIHHRKKVSVFSIFLNQG